jgi:hypothetical protein
MSYTLMTLGGAEIERCRNDFERRLRANPSFSYIEPAHVGPGDDAPVIRLRPSGAEVELALWSPERPTKQIDRNVVPNPCLVPVSALTKDGVQLLSADRAETLMVAGFWNPLNTTEVKSFTVCLTESRAGVAPLLIPSEHWMNWIEPSRDVRQLHFPRGAQWIELAAAL